MNMFAKSKRVAFIVAAIFLLQQCLVPIPQALAHDGILDFDQPLTQTTDPLLVTAQNTTVTATSEDSPLSEASTIDQPQMAKPVSGGSGGRGGKITDTTAPIISSVTLSGLTTSDVTVTWKTDDSSGSILFFGFSPTSLTGSVFSTRMVTNHSLSLTGLRAGSTYYYSVSSKNKVGLTSQSAIFSFTTAGDVTAPIISSVSASNISNTGVMVSWTTNEPTDTRIEYGTTTSYGQSSTLDTNLVLNHSQTLTGLSANTLYHYRVISRDASGNVSVSGDFTFQTIASTTTGPVTIFLNFLGAFIPTWGAYFNLSLSAFAGAISEISKILAGVAEMFSIFNANVTLTDPFVRTQTYANATDEANAKYNYYTQNRIMEAVITDTAPNIYFGEIYAGIGGIAYINSFSGGLVNSALIFARNLTTNASYISTVVAHELGHGFGLSHQSSYDANGTRTSEYYGGYDSGYGWISPIMGSVYAYARPQWWYGTSKVSSTTYQDDIAILSGSQNGFGLRADEAGNATSSAAAFSNLSGTSISTSGVITSSTDEDYYEFTTATDGAVSFMAAVADYSAMLNLVLEIRRADGTLVLSQDTASLGETISNYFLSAGTYYLVVRSKGLYGDVGQYFVAGTVPLGTTTTAGGAAASASAPTSTSTSSSSAGPNSAAAQTIFYAAGSPMSLAAGRSSHYVRGGLMRSPSAASSLTASRKKVSRIFRFRPQG